MKDMAAVDLMMTATIDGRRLKVSTGTVTVQKLFTTKQRAERHFLLMEQQPRLAAKAILEWKQTYARGKR